jgi:hypothetical protein
MCRRVYEDDDDVCCSGYCSEMVTVRKPMQDADTPWRYMGATISPSKVEATFRLPSDEAFHEGERVTITFLLADFEFGSLTNHQVATYEILNSRRDPREFVGRVLPSDRSLYERVHHGHCQTWTSKECADRTCKGWVCEDHAVTCSECNETFHAHCTAVLSDGQTPVCRECLKNVPADIISEVAA